MVWGGLRYFDGALQKNDERLDRHTICVQPLQRQAPGGMFSIISSPEPKAHR